MTSLGTDQLKLKSAMTVILIQYSSTILYSTLLSEEPNALAGATTTSLVLV